LWHESRTKNPMLPLSLFSHRNFAVGNLATFVVYGALSIATLLVSVYSQQVGKFSATESGLALMPITLIMFFLSGRIGALAGKFGPRLFMGIGPIVAGIGFLTMLRVEEKINYASQLLPGVLLFGIGLSITVAPLTTAILGAIDDKQAGIGSAVNNAVSRTAGLITIACLGVIVGGAIDPDGFKRGITIIAGLMFLGGIISLIGIENTSSRESSR